MEGTRDCQPASVRERVEQFENNEKGSSKNSKRLTDNEIYAFIS